MISVLKKYVLGGRSGKREAGWLLFIIWFVSAVIVVVFDVLGNEMMNAYELLKMTFWPVIGFLLSAYGMEWVGSQSPWSKGDDINHYEGG